MKDFFKFTLASILGFIIVGVLLLFLGIGIVVGISSGADQPVTVKENSILQIKLNGTVPDRADNNPLSGFNFATLKPAKSIGLIDVLKSIDYAKTDDNIKGIYLNLNDISSNFGSMATIDEIRDKLLDFKKSGKFIYSYNNFAYTQKSYYLCSVADSVYLNPEGGFTLLGLGGEISFYKKFLNGLGVEPEVIRHGKFKAAVEPFMSDKMSDANRVQTMTYLNSIWANMLGGISSVRNISVERLNQLADDLAIRKAEDAVKYNLLDDLLYEDQMLDKLKKITETKDDKPLRFVSLYKYSKSLIKKDKFSDNKIAVIYASGEIVESNSPDKINSSLAKVIRKARKDKNIKAIVLRVNSPGGSALVSDIIWREVVLAQQVKPVIASMGNVAASGGYYISCAAETIVADPNTITGSIGVFGLIFNGQVLLEKMLGITTDNFGTNKYSNFGGGHPLGLPLSSRKLTSFERDVIQSSVEGIYTKFISKVAKGRSMTLEQVDNIGQGRVWNAIDAKKIGLVDEIGGLERAIEIAKEKAQISDYRLISLPKQKDPVSILLEGLSAKLKSDLLKSELGLNFNVYNKAKKVLDMTGVQTRIPYTLEIK